MEPALQGITVLDFATVGPAARCSRVLADYGARVVKVGAPPRKSGVQIEPPPYAYSGQRAMQRVRIDLKSPDGVATFLRLAEKADVVIESFRPGVVDRLGIAYEDVRRVNERIVYCSTSGYGQTGPRARWAGHDLNYLADGGPALPGATIADGAAGGMHAAIAILAALLRRERSGVGEYLDVSVADGMLALMALSVDQHLATGQEPGPGHDILTGRYACYDLYRARDGRWLSVAAIEPAFYANLCTALGLEQWIPHQHDDARQDEIRAAFRDAFAKRDRDPWVSELAPADTCVAPVQSVAEAAADPQFESRGAFVAATHEGHGRLRQLGTLLAGQRLAGDVALPDTSTTDTEALLKEAGLAPGEIEALRLEGVVA
jgi:alpha-methylacyl-CoA racemase